MLFLHGWLGSWRYWYPTIKVVADHFRTYSLDFWGFGDSRRKNIRESIQNYSEQVVRFLDELGIDRIPLVGHSMGGMVALKTAIDHPDRIACVTTVGAPVQGSSLSWLLKLTDIEIFANAFAHWPWLRRSLFRFFLGESRDSSIHEVIDDSLKSSANTLRSAVSSMLRTDLCHELSSLYVPTLVIHGSLDDIVDSDQVELFVDNPAVRVVRMPHSRHFPFLDEPEFFNTTLLQFLKESSFLMSPANGSGPHIFSPLN